MESGILELYVLGDVTPGEKLQVEEMAAKHPAIKAELDEIEQSLEAYAGENEVEPPAHLRGRILNSLVTNLSDDNTFNRTSVQTEEDNVVPFIRPKVNNFYKYAFAACLVLLLASSVALIGLYNRLQQSNNQLAALQLNNQHFTNTVSLLDQQLAVFRDPSFKFLKLQGTPKTPADAMTIAWSPVKHRVLIDLSSIKMAANDQEHQYQLWAIVAGKPVDLVFLMKNRILRI